MDVLNKEQRRKNMSAIRSKDTAPEVYFRKELFKKGFRYRVNQNSIFGHPDIFLRKYNTAIFINGCYWHRHQGCKYCTQPKTNIEFWNSKFKRNLERDRDVKQKLMETKIKQVVIWECTIKRMKRDSAYHDQVLAKVISFFENDDYYLEI